MLCNHQTTLSTIMSKPVPDQLAVKHAHERDAFISFDEGPHVYTVHGDDGFTSVTTWIHSHFAKFDADGILDKMFKGKKMQDPTYKYYGMSREEIKLLWSQNDAAQKGTDLHYDIECYYNGLDVKNDSEEFQYFLQFAKDFAHLKPYRTEWIVFYEELRLAGSIDMVFQDEAGDLWIYDWKRTNKDLAPHAYGGKTSHTPCIAHVEDCAFWHYSMQLNLYRGVLERKYGKSIKGMYLVRLHPDYAYKTYDRIEVPFMDKEIEDLFAYRKEQVMMEKV
jgi:ATP-dependent exoDNAse (exonuclease V) beta subunit